MSEIQRERLQHEGRLAEAKRQINDLRLRLTGLRTSLRAELDPIEPVDNPNGELIASLALSLADVQTQLMEQLRKAALIRRVLGR